MRPFLLHFVFACISVVLSAMQSLAAAPGEFEDTGSMITGRLLHTGTLLPNGKVLVAGGCTTANGTAIASTELYDPASGTWSAAGSMAGSRHSHTATLLSNGSVLVAGGLIRPYSILDPLTSVNRQSAELYNPSSGMWSDAGSFLGSDHTATLLPDGKVLLAGGWYQGGIHNAFQIYTNAARLYDPASNTWSATGNMASYRSNHTATLLPNGKVLVAGGYVSGLVLNRAELYDPATGTWSPTGNLTHPRYDHTATLLRSGKVLVAGGANNEGGQNAAATDTAELYDPSTGTWTETGSLTSSRDDHTATLLASDRVLVTGGSSGGPLATAEIYDPTTGNWSSTGDLRQPHRFHTATLLPDNRVLIAGGGTNDLAGAELYTEPPTPPSLLNISTRVRIQTGDNAMIGGFIITGTQTKTVIVRGIGPSLGMPGALQDPVIEVHGPSGELLGTNDNWRDALTRQQIIDSGLAPANDTESALWGVINPGPYTVVVRGKNDTTGIGLFEVYDLDQTADSVLANVSTRGVAQTGDDVMIGGLIVGGGAEGAAVKVVVRAIGPSLPLVGALQNPTLELRDASGTLVVFNDDWKTRPDGTSQQAEIEATNLQPTNDVESAVVELLTPSSYTAIVRGKDNTTGAGLVEVYQLR